MALTFDPTASLPANYIVDEAQVASTDAVIYPIEQPFYSLDFQLWGTRLSDSVEVELKETIDFIFSPIFYSVAATTNKNIHSFVIIFKSNLYTNYRITYRGVGGVIDDVLDDEITAAVGFDRTDAAEWTKFEGQDFSLRANSINSSHHHAGIIEQTEILTQAIINSLQRPYFKRDEEVAKIAVALATNAEINSTNANINSLLALELVDPPVINSPIENSIDYVHIDKININIIGSNDRYEGLHAATDWEIATDSGFSNIVDSSYNDTVNLLNWDPESIIASTIYYVRSRLISDFHRSDWSTVVSFTTNSTLVYIETPIINSPVNNELRVSPLFTIAVDPFNVINGSDTHISTDWEISLTSDFSNIIYQKLASEDLVSHVVDTELELSTIYYVRAKFNGDVHTSTWSSITTITTATILEAIKLIGGSTGNETFNSVIFDSVTGFYVCVGQCSLVGAGALEAYIAIFDSSLNLIDDKTIGGTSTEIFNDIIKDPSTGNYVCVGSSDSTGAGLTDAYIAIFNTSLILQNNFLIGSTGNETFNSVIFDSVTGFYVCVGESTTFRNPLNDGYLAIFNPSLVLQNDRLIFSTGNLILNGLTIDPNTGNYIVVGYSSTEGAGGDDGYIAIFNTALVLQNDLLIGGVSNERFNDIIFDSTNNNYIVVGYSDSAGTGLLDGLIVIFDNVLTLIANKLVGGLTNDLINNLTIDPATGNYVCVGYSSSAGAGLTESFIAIFDTALVLQSNKLIGGTGDEVFNGITTKGDDYIVIGHSDSTGAGLNDAVIMTFLKDLTLSDGVIPNITLLSISTPTLTEVIPILTEIAPVFTEGNPTFAENTPTLIESNPVFTETFSTY